MREIHNREMDALVDRYMQSKEGLCKVVTAIEDLPTSQEYKDIRSLEKEVEESFSALLEEQPSTLAEALTKARFFIEEVLADAELANYQKQSLHALLKDFSSLQN